MSQQGDSCLSAPLTLAEEVQRPAAVVVVVLSVLHEAGEASNFEASGVASLLLLLVVIVIIAVAPRLEK